MGNDWPLPTMEGKILMSKESENIVRQWAEQKQIQKNGDPMLNLMRKLMKPQPNRNQTASKPQKKKKK